MEKFNSIFYMYSSMDSSSQILLFLIVLVVLMLFSIVIINAVTSKKNLNVVKKDNTTNIKQVNNKKDVTNIENTNKTIKEENNKKQEDEEIEVIEVETDESSIESISKLIEDTLEQEPINLTSFEEEQEKDAIISYDELVKRAGAKKIVYKKKEEPVKLHEEKKVDENNINSDNKFKASKIVSPIYGIQKEQESNNDIFIDLEDFDLENKQEEDINEIKGDMEFLSSLKSFRSNLD